MNINLRLFCFLWVFMVTASLLLSGEGILLELRLYKGVKDAREAPGSHINSYTLKKIADACILSDAEAAKERKSITKIYNLKYVEYLYRVAMLLEKGRTGRIDQNIVLDQKKMNMQLSHVSEKNNLFQVQILNKEADGKSLLEAEIIIPEEKTAVLGFEDSDGNIFFLALNRKRDQAVKERGIVRSVENPELLNRVEPLYPREALEKNVSGIVLLECHTDLQGKIKNVHIIEGPDLLARAAKSAVANWKYSPWKINGKPEPVRMHLMVFFTIKDESIKSPDTSEKGISETYERYKPMMKKWKTSYPVSDENKTIVEIIIVEGEK